MTAAEQPGDAAGSARKAELLAAAYDWVCVNGWADLSLRPLAEAIGSSPRVLLFLFASKDGLIAALLARSREEQLDLLATLRPDRAGPSRGLGPVGERVWLWLVAPGRRGLLRLWLEAYSRSVGSRSGPWHGFAEQTVRDWDDLLASHQPAALRTTPDGVSERALLLAVLRGALLDLLATGDEERLTAAVRRHLARAGAG